MPDKIHLSLLSLHPLAITSLPSSRTSPAELASFNSRLRDEAAALYSSQAWTNSEVWHEGLVTTASLPHDAATYTTVSEHLHAHLGSDNAPTQQEKKFSFSLFAGSKNKAAAFLEPPTGFTWHLRETIVPSDKGYSYQRLWDTLAVNHCQSEIGYVAGLTDVESVGDNNCFLKLYQLPFPTKNRSFLTHVVTLDTTPAPVAPESLRSFLVMQLPVHDPSLSRDNGYVRGLYVAVEEVAEVSTPNGTHIRWRSASMSTPGGSIPAKTAESHKPRSMAGHVVDYFRWLDSQA